MQEFSGKTAVVTGAASGIGRALVLKFAGAGCRVVAADVDAAGLEETRKLAEAAGAQALAVHCDVTRQDNLDACADAAYDAFGAVHILCNNAGVLSGGTTWELPIEDYQWQIAVNTLGPIHGVRSFVPRMLAQDSEGHIVNTASMAGLTTMPFAGAYHLSKHACLAFTECLYHELKETKLGVSVLCPELINTGIAASERVRPEGYQHRDKDYVVSPAGKLVVDALAEGMKTGGLAPSVMADRVYDAIVADRFYIIAEDAWRDACNQRLEDIRLGRNPTFAPPTSV
ncbi:MAG: SDR family NAD(P)-dependent oxidoreductase [Myxococcota bacterium]|jgi:NAD(P)-dependent dehydrogenase (short-subunit alcohol dehydrogenase family)|nr:SDR family NAD(P)-dependent oxidoreductase [Myxococcota bacterium]